MDKPAEGSANRGERLRRIQTALGKAGARGLVLDEHPSVTFSFLPPDSRMKEPGSLDRGVVVDPFAKFVDFVCIVVRLR